MITDVTTPSFYSSITGKTYASYNDAEIAEEHYLEDMCVELNKNMDHSVYFNSHVASNRGGAIIWPDSSAFTPGVLERALPMLFDELTVSEWGNYVSIRSTVNVLHMPKDDDMRWYYANHTIGRFLHCWYIQNDADGDKIYQHLTSLYPRLCEEIKLPHIKKAFTPAAGLTSILTWKDDIGYEDYIVFTNMDVPYRRILGRLIQSIKDTAFYGMYPEDINANTSIYFIPGGGVTQSESE